LKERCRPYFDAVENYLSKIRMKDSVAKQYQLPLSSTPEYNDNSIKAWFPKFTNYDLALVKNLYKEYVDVLENATKRSPKEIFLDAQLYPALDTNQTGLTLALVTTWMSRTGTMHT
jgi:alpha-L-fucosidase 2